MWISKTQEQITSRKVSTAQAVVVGSASSVKRSEWILTRVSQCSTAFTPGYHVLPSALFGAQPSTHQHQLAPEVPLNSFPLPCAASSSLSNLKEFFFPPPAAPCHAKNWSGAPFYWTDGVGLKPTKLLFRSAFNQRDCFRHHRIVLENRRSDLFPFVLFPVMQWQHKTACLL